MRSAAFADEGGAGLVEVLAAVAIMAIVLTIFLSALSTGSFGVSAVRERVTAENLARSQLEYTKNYTYSVTPYPTIVPPAGYAITIGISYWFSPTNTFTSNPSADSGMQWITVTVYHSELTPTFTMEEYKVDR